MSSDASTLPLRDTQVGGPAVGRGLRGRAGTFARAGESAWPGAVCLVAIVLCSLIVVLMAANRPSVLSATSHANYFPHWMTGPLGGLLPWITRSTVTLKYLFSGAIVAMYVSYLAGLSYVPRLRARWAIATVLAVHLVFFLSPPLALTDIFNYVNYGRMEIVHHLNPYTTIPILEPHDDPSYDLCNWHQLLSPYGPLFTMLTFVVVPARGRRHLLGAEGRARALEPGHAAARVEVRAPARARPRQGDRARRPQPDRARVGPRRRPQRLHHGLPRRARLLPALAHARARQCGRAAGGGRLARAGGRGRRRRGRRDHGGRRDDRRRPADRGRRDDGAGGGVARAPGRMAHAAVGRRDRRRRRVRRGGRGEGIGRGADPGRAGQRAAQPAAADAGAARDGAGRRDHGGGEPDLVRPARTRPEHPEPPRHERQRAQPDRTGARHGGRDRRAAPRAQRRR